MFMRHCEKPSGDEAIREIRHFWIVSLTMFTRNDDLYSLPQVIYKIRHMNTANPSPWLSFWLYFCAGMVFCMIVIGAITRLTESGLSMVEWQPLIGFLPPLSPEEWQRVFDLYKQSPEFQHKNFWMTLPDFQRIFFWEWFHRLWGRLIGLAYALPFFYFLARGIIPRGYRLKLFGLLLLGGAQGALGWFMVASGLVDMPAVSHYRLAAHLALAFVILALLIWAGLALSPAQDRRHADAALYRHGWLVVLFFAVTMIWGAFTAGLDGGLIYNDSFPLMGGRWVPEEVAPAAGVVWPALWAHPAGVQFAHRWLAMILALMIFGFCWRALRRGRGIAAVHALALMTIVQLGLGLATLLSQVWLPLAVLHQAGAAVICMLLVICLYAFRPQPGRPVFAAADNFESDKSPILPGR